MNADFTEAVKADTTTVKTTVKRLRKGDVREDGKIFWQYASSCVNGEYWMTPKKFTEVTTKQANNRAKLALEKETAQAIGRRHRCGDVRDDGKVFWAYDPSRVSGERWLTPKQFKNRRDKQNKKDTEKKIKLLAKRKAVKATLRHGETRGDGMVFWSYKPSCSRGEHWKTLEQFMADRAKINARNRERRATDPLFALKGRLRCRVSEALKRKGMRKNSKTEAMLGCSYAEFRDHIESKFLPSMTWETFLSDGHIDHHVPLDAATTEEDVYALNHYTNLRPMWGPENLAKNDTLPEEHELPDNLHPKVKEIYLTAKARSA